jgi:hypothetical protein
MGFNVLKSVEYQPSFRRNMSPPYMSRIISDARNQLVADSKRPIAFCLQELLVAIARKTSNHNFQF